MYISDFISKDILILSMMQVLFNNNSNKIKLFKELIDTLGISLHLDYSNINTNISLYNFINKIQNINNDKIKTELIILDANIQIYNSTQNNINNNNNDNGEKSLILINNEHESLVKIGEGGFGNVYKYYNIIDDKHYALKKISVENVEDVQRIVKESRIMAKLQHKNIVQYSYSWIENSRFLNIEMELCLADLHYYLSNRKQYDWCESLYISNDILDGIEYLHNNDIIHGDISSKNIFISSDYKIKIGDFGLSTCTTEELVSISNSTSYFYGNPIYGSPEILNSNKYCKQSDIYSFGILLFELMSKITSMHQRNIYIRKLKNNLICIEDINKISILPLFENLKYLNILKLLIHNNYTKRPSASEVQLMLLQFKHIYYNLI